MTKKDYDICIPGTKLVLSKRDLFSPWNVEVNTSCTSNDWKCDTVKSLWCQCWRDQCFRVIWSKLSWKVLWTNKFYFELSKKNNLSQYSDIGHHSWFWSLCLSSLDYLLFSFPIFLLRTYLMKVIPEPCRAH
jgi:hypothetical protein